MSKRNKGRRHVKTEKVTLSRGDVKTVTAAEILGNKTPAAATPETPEIKPALIKVLKHDGKYSGARKAWYDAIRAYDGKTVDAFVEATRTPEGCPAKTKNGTCEPPMGWVGFFKREGMVQVLNP